MQHTTITHDVPNRTFRVGGTAITYGSRVWRYFWYTYFAVNIITPIALSLIVTPVWLIWLVFDTLLVGVPICFMNDENAWPAFPNAASAESAFRKAKQTALNIDEANLQLQEFNDCRKEECKALETLQ